jgi:acyl transferase domain-containing protein
MSSHTFTSSILNSDGKSYSFDSRGSGYGRGEGAGMVVLKRLDKALEAGDHIRAIIRGTGVGQDGRTSGITLPSGSAQENLVRSVYQQAGLDPTETIFVEAHGTGTIQGDISELSSLQAVFGGQRNIPFYIGSIKPNIGHLESAAGVAGLIKAVLMLEHDSFPPNLNLETIKKQLNLDTTQVIVSGHTSFCH